MFPSYDKEAPEIRNEGHRLFLLCPTNQLFPGTRKETFREDFRVHDDLHSKVAFEKDLDEVGDDVGEV